MARETERARAAVRLRDAQEVLRAVVAGEHPASTKATARVRVEHRAAVVRAEEDMEQRRHDFYASG